MKKIFLAFILSFCGSLLLARFFFSTHSSSKKFSHSESATYQKEKSSSHLLDISQLFPEDLSFLSESDRGELYLVKGVNWQKVLYQQHPLSSVSFSPLKNKVAFTFYLDQEKEELSLMVYDRAKKSATEVFHAESSWDINSDPQWLDETHVFFFRHCGTDCDGITLVDTQTQKTHIGRFYYISSVVGKRLRTNFVDWFHHQFWFKGQVSDIHAEIINGASYLVLTTIDESGKSLGEKRFLFTGTSLVSS